MKRVVARFDKEAIEKLVEIISAVNNEANHIKALDKSDKVEIKHLRLAIMMLGIMDFKTSI